MPRTFLAVLLFALTAFCVFGFLATFEPTGDAVRWRIGYGVVGSASLLLGLRLLRRGRTS